MRRKNITVYFAIVLSITLWQSDGIADGFKAPKIAKLGKAKDGFCKPNRLIVSTNKLVIACTEKKGFSNEVVWFSISGKRFQNDTRFVDRAITLASTAVVSDLWLRFSASRETSKAYQINSIEIFR